VVLPLIISGLEAAGEAAPTIGAIASRALPWLSAAAGASPALKKGDPFGAVVQGGLGYVGGKGMQGLAGIGQRMAGQALAPLTGSAISATEAASKIPGIGKLVPELADVTKLSLAQKAGLGSNIVTQFGKPLAAVGMAAVPVAGAAYLANQALAGGGGTGGGGGYGGGGGLYNNPINPGNIGGGIVQAAGGGAAGVPATPNIPGLNQGMLPYLGGAYGPGQQPTLYTALGPGGPGDVARQWIAKNADTLLDISKKQAAAEVPYMLGYKSADLMNQLAAAGIRQNIATQAANIQGGFQTAQDIAKQAATDIGAAGRTLYQYQ
jgi:hypothetical protein